MDSKKKQFREFPSSLGGLVKDIISEMVEASKLHHVGYKSELNGVLVYADENSDPIQLGNDWEYCMDNQLPEVGPDKLEISDEFRKELEERRELRARISQKNSEVFNLKEQLKRRIFEWDVKNQEYEVAEGKEQDLQTWFDNNKEPYGRRCITYAQDWAKLMQVELKKGNKLTAELVKKLSHQADVDGITGFMYGASKAVLKSTWKYWDLVSEYLEKEF